MASKRMFIPPKSVTTAELVLVTMSVHLDLGLDPEKVNRSHVGKELLRRFGVDD